MRKHISEVALCDSNHVYMQDCDEDYHKDDFCLLCGYETEGDRLYMEIHGSDGASNAVKQIDSAQPYACMECTGEFEVTIDNRQGKGYKNMKLIDFFKEGKK